MIKSDAFNIKNYEDTKVIELKPKLGRNDLCYCGSGKNEIIKASDKDMIH